MKNSILSRYEDRKHHFKKRCSAYLIDLTIIVLSFSFIKLSFMFVAKNLLGFVSYTVRQKTLNDQSFDLYFNGLLLTTFILYFSLSYYLTGTTIGKMLFNMKLIGEGEKITPRSALMRPMGYLLCHATLYLPFLIPLCSKSGKGVQDLISNTTITNIESKSDKYRVISVNKSIQSQDIPTIIPKSSYSQAA